MPRISQDPFQATLVIACMMHVSAALLFGHFHRSHAEAPKPIATAEMELAIDSDIVATDEADPVNRETIARANDEPTTSAASAPVLIARTGTMTGSTSAISPSSTETASPAATEVITAPSSAAPADWSFNASVNPGNAPNLFAGVSARAIAPQDAPPRSATGVPAVVTSKTGGLTEALDAADRAKGLGHGGPVLSAVEDAAHSPDTPAEGFAEFEVVVKRSGAITVSLVKANDENQAWATMVHAIKTNIAARKVNMPESASGMRFVVRVDAVVQWPDGKRPASVGTHTFATAGSFGKGQPGLEPKGAPMIGVYRVGKVVSVGAALAPGAIIVGGSISPENIGNAAARIIHGRMVTEERLD